MAILELSSQESALLRRVLAQELQALRSGDRGEVADTEARALEAVLRRLAATPDAIGRGPGGERATPAALLTDTGDSIVRRYWAHDGLSADPEPAAARAAQGNGSRSRR